MSRTSRDNMVADILSMPKKQGNGYGGLERKTAAVVEVADYGFYWFPPGTFSRTKTIEEYGLTDDAEIIFISGEFDAGIKAGHLVEFDGVTYKLIGVTPINGASGTPVALSIVAVKERQA